MILIQQSLNDQDYLKCIHNAAVRYADLEGKTFLVIGKNKNSGYYWFQCRFEAKNFMHLLGIKSKTLTADEFFQKAFEYDAGSESPEDQLSIKDCSPSRNHSRTTLNEKVSSAIYLFQIENAKYMQVGEKDKVSQFVDFSYTYGHEAVLGFQKLSSESFPVTLIPRNIDEFVTKKYRVIFILSKKMEDKTYGILNAEIKKDILSELLPEFPDELKQLESENVERSGCGNKR